MRLTSLRLSPAGKRWMVPGLKKYFCDLSLDPNTAYRHLSLSDDNRTMTWVKEAHQRPNHEDGFTYYAQVLGDTELKGCCYWEVDWAGQGGVSIAATYKGISRKGKGMECRFGDNDLSWSLRICDGDYFFWHNNIYTSNISSGKGGVSSDRKGMSSGRVGVFLDFEGGALSFYRVSADGELFHLHTFCSSFSEPLFPGFRLWTEGSSLSLVKKEEIVSSSKCGASFYD
ncbi:hypothetical protein WMY93_026978 [Mugilogobius chulae]|uniref:B30.2/SPRY domain-containing protein n=1 Tax=Mugilogobius chulae TaxID=88201 RepID=A0AAW0N2J9_9GOBI